MVRCLVCSRDYDGTQHMGLETCRACTAFYRRSVLKKQTYVCRRGLNQCVLNTTRKEMCQKCRFQKCIEVGLEFGYGSRSKQGPVLATLEKQPIYINSVKLDYSIERIYANYIKSCDRRLSMEMLLFTSKKCEPIIVGQMKYLKLSLSEMSTTIHSQVPSLLEFYCQCYPIFDNFSFEDKHLLMKETLTDFWLLEECYRTCIFWTNNPDLTNLFLFTLVCVVDKTNFSTIYDPRLENNEKNAIEVEKIFMRQFKKIESIIANMQQLDLKEYEFGALIGLLLWSKIKDLNIMGVKALGHKECSTICDELHDIYRNKCNIENYSLRLYQLCDLITQILTLKVKEEMDLLNLFNFFHSDNFILNFIRNT